MPKAPDELVTVIPFRPYDAPDITARQFLEACMRSPNVSLALRIDAANKLLKLEPAQPLSAWSIPRACDQVHIGGIPSVMRCNTMQYMTCVI